MNVNLLNMKSLILVMIAVKTLQLQHLEISVVELGLAMMITLKWLMNGLVTMMSIQGIASTQHLALHHKNRRSQLTLKRFNEASSHQSLVVGRTA